MTMKDRARAKGREIRRLTGIPLPLAMLAGKRIVRNRSFDIHTDERFKEYVKARQLCGDGCCGYTYTLVGKKGQIDLNTF